MIRYCPKCGNELAKEGNFCAACGFGIKKIEQEPPQNTVREPVQKIVPNPEQTTRQERVRETMNKSAGMNGQKAPENKGNGKAVIAAVCAVALIGACAGGYFFLQRKPGSVNMNPYLYVTFSGVDGEGYANSTFDLAKLIADNKKVFSLNDEQRKKIMNISHIEDADGLTDNELVKSIFDDMYDNGPVCLQIEPETGLHNDDKVTASWVCGEETLEDLFGVNFIFDHASYTVKDLEENKKAEKEAVKEEAPEEEAVPEEAETETKAEEKPAEKSSNKPVQEEKTKNFGTYKLVNTDYLTLRSTPSLNNTNNKILQIPGNAEVTVLEFGPNGYWKVEYQGYEGYIVPSYLYPSSGAMSPKKKADYRVITDYVTLRDIPSTEGEAKMTINNGAVVELYDTADNGFMLVQYGGQMGYILEYYQGEHLIQKN